MTTSDSPRIADWFGVEGSAFPLGVTWIEDEQAFNFALYSKHATRVALLLFREDDVTAPVARIEFNYLTNKSGRVWHARLSETSLNGATYYGYQIDGPPSGEGFDLHAFDPQKVLLDPYAKEVYFPDTFDREAAMRPGSNMGLAPLGVLPRSDREFDWSGDRVRHHEHDLVVYEVHVRGFTRNPNSGVPEDRRGTYLGVIDQDPVSERVGRHGRRVPSGSPI